jgi:hypothetical protein
MTPGWMIGTACANPSAQFAAAFSESFAGVFVAGRALVAGMPEPFMIASLTTVLPGPIIHLSH